MVKKMNLEFHSYMDGGDHSITSAYEAMVNKNPFKVLANFSYDWEEQPLRNVHGNAAQMTDVSFFNFFLIFLFLFFFLLSWHAFTFKNITHFYF